MDILQYLSEKSSILTNVYDSISYYGLDLAIRVQIWGLNNFPKGLIEGGNMQQLQQHPAIMGAFGACFWASSKLGLKEWGERTIKYISKKSQTRKIDKGLEGKL